MKFLRIKQRLRLYKIKKSQKIRAKSKEDVLIKLKIILNGRESKLRDMEKAEVLNYLVKDFIAHQTEEDQNALKKHNEIMESLKKLENG